MIAKPGPEKYLYEARLIFQRDEKARLEKAEIDGRTMGRVEGRPEVQTLGRILLCQELLGLPQSSAEELAALDLAQLTSLADELQSRLKLPQN